MKASRLSQKLHKWLGLLVGAQLVVWSLSGFYMVVIDLSIIHGDHLIRPAEPISQKDIKLFSDQLEQLVAQNNTAAQISLSTVDGIALTQIATPYSTSLMLIESGAEITQITEPLVRQRAQAFYAGTGTIESVTLISENPPREIGARPLPLWRVDFDDIWGTTLYISGSTGALVTRRHTLWRIFDFAWMLHIMDYEERENINNSLLRTFSLLAFFLVVTGVWYLYFRLNAGSWLRRRLAR